MFFSHFARLRRLRSLLAFAFVLLAFAPAAFAQDAPAPAVGGFDFSMLAALLSAIGVALLGLWSVGRDLVNRMASRPAVDGWDKAKATMDKLEPWADTLAKIADPKVPMTAPTPGNPSGAAQ